MQKEPVCEAISGDNLIYYRYYGIIHTIYRIRRLLQCRKLSTISMYMAAKNALENAVIDLDMNRLAAAIGTINDIGDKRLEQIIQ